MLHKNADKSIIDAFVQEEMSTPSARKIVNGVTIYKQDSFIYQNILASSL